MTAPPRPVSITLDGQTVTASEGSTILEACRRNGIDTPTLCYLENLTPINVCRVCVVELEGSRVLVPACSRKVEPGMVIRTDSDRVRLSRRMVLEFLASSADLSTASPQVKGWMDRYGARPDRFGPPAPPAECPASPAGGTAPALGGATGAGAAARDHAQAGHHHPVPAGCTETVAQPVKVDNDLYVRDYAKCILCYKCVEACGADAQNTFAIAVAGRGFDARISTEYALPLPDSACVYCGNCIGVCPTGALMFKSEHDRRRDGTWDEARQTVTDTICPYCGVGCTLQLHVQDNRIVKVTSPLDHEVTHGHLCVKGRFGWQFVQNRAGAGDAGGAAGA